MSAPVVIACPYLPLATPITFAGWWIGPLTAFEGPWRDRGLENRARRFLGAFRLATGAITRPTLIARVVTGVDGVPPTREEIGALETTIAFAAIHTNPYWDASTTSMLGHSIVTADNADLWVQPLAENGGIALERGFRRRTLSGGHSVFDDAFIVPSPVEVDLPLQSVRLDEDLVDAMYAVLSEASEPGGLNRRVAVAAHWLTKTWKNTPSLTEHDRVVDLKTAIEALAGTSDRVEVGEAIVSLFRSAVTQEGAGAGVDELAWSPSEQMVVRTWTNKSGQSRSEPVTAIEHWLHKLADVRNGIVHEGASPDLTYEAEGSQYTGPMLEVGDRVVREAITVAIGACGHPRVWRRGLSRARFDALRRLDQMSDDSD